LATASHDGSGVQRRPTIKDVAARAKVHPGTASRALNPETRGMVNSATANRVLKAAKQLNYSPNSTARSLRTRSSHVVGVVVPDITNPIFPPIVRGIEDGLREAGYVALLGNTDGDPRREEELLSTMRSRQTDGFILATSSRTSSFGELETSGLPVVLVNRRTRANDVPSVTPDNAEGIDSVIQFLHDRGHTRIGHVAGPQDLSTGWERHRAFLASMNVRDLDVDPDKIAFCDAFTLEAGYKGASAILEHTRDFTAIVAGNDLIALGCLSALKDRALSCPEEVSVVGFNDMPFLDRQVPALTTVHIPQYEIGLEAARLFVERVAHPELAVKHIVVPTSLVIRSSVSSVQ
jgi:LacI family transcriptional regulator